MKVGSLVECIYDGTWDKTDENFVLVEKNTTGPVKGNIYVVSGVSVPMEGFITLEEYPGKFAFHVSGFREVQPPTSIEKLIEESEAITV